MPDLLLHQLELAMPEGCCIQHVIHPTDDSTMALAQSRHGLGERTTVWAQLRMPQAAPVQLWDGCRLTAGGSSALPLPGACLRIRLKAGAA